MRRDILISCSYIHLGFFFFVTGGKTLDFAITSNDICTIKFATRINHLYYKMKDRTSDIEDDVGVSILTVFVMNQLWSKQRQFVKLCTLLNSLAWFERLGHDILDKHWFEIRCFHWICSLLPFMKNKQEEFDRRHQGLWRGCSWKQSWWVRCESECFISMKSFKVLHCSLIAQWVS